VHNIIHLVVQALLAGAFAQESAAPKGVDPLELKGVVELPGVEGRIDHLAVDLARERLFIAALGNDSIEVVDLKAGKHLQSLRGPGQPQGIVYLADHDRLVVASGKDGTCTVYDGGSLESVASLRVGEDADNLRYDPQQKRLYVGYGEGAIGILDVESWKVVERIEVEGHPEGFQVSPESERVFVNVPDAHQISVIDLGKHSVLARWKIDEAGANFPLALLSDSADPEGGLVLVGCRSPARLVLRSIASGNRAGALELSGDTDDLFYDPAHGRILAICGEGFVDVFGKEQDAFERVARFPTAPGARTGLFVPERNELFVAVPHRGSQRAEVRMLGVKD
jgi:DNA-binding beta-propeller fold protein YncE